MTLLITDGWMLPCMSKQLTGMDCPGCGIQRSISFLLQGHLTDSFLMYPGLFPGIFLFFFLIFDWFTEVKYSEQIKLWATLITIGTIITSFLVKMAIH
ncbi:DUF2752 domain-containing protein [Nonlabens sp. Ci31]|jgi:uncharacterized membrane protein|uniref:DUF2752 domain-containing protein n=1 Tax=Nonlabens sp. Ci31 TaxID=2608253 RepID=UPI001462F7FB|nr:DUF2752 domain-containing protein [Nonlabens sp. Ci31]QJP33131.1 DUF2752 domain-containing protein [Nonlabens sp. Ci31]